MIIRIYDLKGNTPTASANVLRSMSPGMSKTLAREIIETLTDPTRGGAPIPITVKENPTSGDLALFGSHFHYSHDIEPKKEKALKLFRVQIDYDMFYNVLVLATDEDVAKSNACFEIITSDEVDLKYEADAGRATITVSELTSFKDGQVLSVNMD